MTLTKYRWDQHARIHLKDGLSDGWGVYSHSVFSDFVSRDDIKCLYVLDADGISMCPSVHPFFEARGQLVDASK